MSDQSNQNAYWRANLRLIGLCVVIWALISLGSVLIFRTVLSGITLGGVDLSQWLVQNGSILAFLGLIVFYVWRMRTLDERTGGDGEL